MQPVSPRRALLAEFIPGVFCVSHNFEPSLRRPESRSGAGEASRAIHQQFHALAGDGERLAFARELSAVIHERRHFHEWIGTAYGLQMFYQLQRIVNEFAVRCIPALRRSGEVRLPLRAWCGRPDCPDEVLGFVEAYDQASALLEWWSGSSGVEAPDGAPLSSWVPPGRPLSLPLPLASLDLPGGTVRAALGGLHLEEGIAFTLENLYLRARFGDEMESMYNALVMQSPEGADYLGALSLFYALAGSADLELFIRAASFALNGTPYRADYREGHPGWRFVLLLEQLGMEAEAGRDDPFARAVERLAPGLGWRRPDAVRRAALDYCEAQVEDCGAKVAREPGLVTRVNLTYYRWARDAFRGQLDGRVVLDGFAGYAASFHALPGPPFTRFRRNGQVVLQCDLAEAAERGAWVQWLMACHAVPALTEGGEVTCAFKHFAGVRFDCPLRDDACGRGARYGTRDGVPCAYHHFLHGFGLLDAKVARLD